jgi:hypothetical protein
MPISAAELIVAQLSTEAVQIPSVDYAKLVMDGFLKQLAEVVKTVASAVASAAQVGYEPRYFPPPFTTPPVQEKRVHIVINLIVDTPSQG